MCFDEIEGEIGQRSAVVVTLSRSRIRHFRALHRQPIGIYGRLFLEVAFKSIRDVLQTEGAHGTAGYAVRRCCERAVDQLGGNIAVLALDQLSR